MSRESTAKTFAEVIGKLDPARLAAWDDAGMSVLQVRVLRYVEAHPGCANMELANALGVTRPSISAVLERLDAKGLIRRDISKRDRRGIEINLEPSAAGLLDGGKSVVAAVEELLSGLSEAESDRLGKILAKVAD